MEILILLIIIGGVFIVVISKYNEKREKERRQEIASERIKEASEVIESINTARKFPVVSTALLLKQNEFAIRSEVSTLYETRAVRGTTGGAIRIAKGAYIGKSVSESKQELRAIDTGVLILTNQRIVFDGTKENRNILIKKIISVEMAFDVIEISSENRQKSQIFSVKNPPLWESLVNAISKTDDFNNVPKLSIAFE